MALPRLKSLVIRDFRSISGEWVVPFDAEVVLIHGQNGAGKTSLLSALELAATGRISYLDRLGDDGYRNHLNHRGTRSGQIRLEVSDSADRASGSATVAAAGAYTQPLLAGRLAETFIERCFLPQATLGNLFEVYAPKRSSDDSPLLRFVKEVLGLDALDSLIDGLHSAGDVRRAQKQSSSWGDAETQVTELSRRRETIDKARNENQAKFDALYADLESFLSISADQSSSLFDVIARMDSANAENSVNSDLLRSALLRISAIESMLVQEELLNKDPNDEDATSTTGIAEKRYLEWRSGRAAPLFQWYDEFADTARRKGDPKPIDLLREIRLEIRDAETSLANARRSQDVADEVEARLLNNRLLRAGLDEQVKEISSAQALISGGSAAEGLASALVSLLEHLGGETCPVCDQGFTGSLRAHVLGKVDSLNADASSLLQLETRRARLEAERNGLEARIAHDESLQVQLGETAALSGVVADHASKIGDLRSLESLAEAGLLLWDEIDRLRATESEIAHKRNLLEKCLAELREIADLLQVNWPRGLLAQQVASLRANAQGQLGEFEEARRRISEAVHKRDELLAVNKQIEDAGKVADDVQREVARLSRQIAEARRRKDYASELRKEAETLRASVTTRVFNEQLNGSWARLFSALVPSEPFVPQFRHLNPGERRLRVDIETRHRDGLQGATPAAMLSQGNLNTAALSLFIALHFAVPPQLPWLIFDDPVQSMDDLHISNFAALVKQLTRRNGRQVVIAVHDRELFDYLSLELTPASPAEELLAITLDRTYGQSVINHDRLRYTEDTALSPTPAA